MTKLIFWIMKKETKEMKPFLLFKCISYIQECQLGIIKKPEKLKEKASEMYQVLPKKRE